MTTSVKNCSGAVSHERRHPTVGGHQLRQPVHDDRDVHRRKHPQGRRVTSQPVVQRRLGPRRRHGREPLDDPHGESPLGVGQRAGMGDLGQYRGKPGDARHTGSRGPPPAPHAPNRRSLTRGATAPRPHGRDQVPTPKRPRRPLGTCPSSPRSGYSEVALTYTSRDKPVRWSARSARIAADVCVRKCDTLEQVAPHPSPDVRPCPTRRCDALAGTESPQPVVDKHGLGYSFRSGLHTRRASRLVCQVLGCTTRT